MADPCPHSRDLSAYHDGELPEPRRLSVEAHLPQCAACRDELRDLRSISRAFAAVRRPAISQQAMARLYRSAPEFLDGAVLRIAEWLTLAAAAVLLVGLLVLPREAAAPSPTAPRVATQGPTPSSITSAAWERAERLQAEAAGDTLAQSEPLRTAQWFAESLSRKNGND